MNKIYSIAVALMASSILMVGCGKQSTSNSLKGVNPENATNGFAGTYNAGPTIWNDGNVTNSGSMTVSSNLTIGGTATIPVVTSTNISAAGLKGSAPIAVLTNALGVGYGAVTITNSLTCTNVLTFSAGGILTGWTHTP